MSGLIQRTGRVDPPASFDRSMVSMRNRRPLIAEPLERGFGLTSAMRCAACCCRRCRGCHHLGADRRRAARILASPGVREDVTDIVLNLKGRRAPHARSGPKRVDAPSEAGVGEAGDDPETRDRGSEPDHVICTLDDGADQHGADGRPARAMCLPPTEPPEDAPIGLIPVDAIFSPVKKVSTRSRTTREGPGARL